MRLIDADALINVLKDPPVHASLCGMTMADVLSLVDEAPTIDAVPVRHGKWERNSARIAGWAKCSECGNMEPPLCTTRFCGHCGALMEEYDETD